MTHSIPVERPEYEAKQDIVDWVEKWNSEKNHLFSNFWVLWVRKIEEGRGELETGIRLNNFILPSYCIKKKNGNDFLKVTIITKH